MRHLCRGLGAFSLALVVLCFGGRGADAQMASGSTSARPMITQPVDRSQPVTLTGNTRPEANTQNDMGALPDGFPMPHMFLQLNRAPEQEQAFASLIKEQHNPASPNFHKWLTAAQIGAQFGAASSDLQKIAAWFADQGFQVNAVYPNGTVVDFSGNAGQVRGAFHTEIHSLSVDGVPHFANMSDPQIPAALAPAIAGVVSLHDFRPQPQFKQNPAFTFGANPTNFAVTPADLETIYNINPLYAAGISGQGQTVYLIEDTDIYTAADWTIFRQAFGLSGFTGGSLTTVHPAASGGFACLDPGANADDGEAILDTEYASAAAPNAAIVVASCANTATDGLLIAVQNLVNSDLPPAIISISYGACEALIGAAANAAFNAAYQQGVAEGVSIFVSSGDQEAAGCDHDTTPTHGLGVSGLASTPYNVAVGGTDFSDTFSGTNGTYWNSTNGASFGSAKSYIPEIPWNTTCASQLYSTFRGFGIGSALCNKPKLDPILLENAGGSGGPSSCAMGSASTQGVVSGTCQGYAKPSWQSGVVGIPNDGVRDTPDVSLFSSFGPWNHAYVICWSDPKFTSDGSAPCNGTPNNWSTGFGGTSFAAPIMAGIQALVNQNIGDRQGNPNVTYYQLAAAEYGSGGSSACNSSNGNGVASSCIFYDITLGDNDAPCTGNIDCYLATGQLLTGIYGALSLSDNAYLPTFKSGVGWDFATGIGSVNAFNLVMNWTSAGAGANTLVVAAILPESRSAVVGNTVTAFATIINTGSSTASQCAIAPTSGLQLNFTYQTTNPLTNALTGGANTPVDIQAGAAQSFVVGLTPTAIFAPVQEGFSFACNNATPAPVFLGVNTLLLSSSAFSVPDIVALALTPSQNGTLAITGVTGTPGCAGCGLNAFALATINLGSSDTITVTPTASPASLPIALTICQTNPATGVCVGGPGSQARNAVLTINPNATPTFAVFAAASGPIGFVPETNRIFVEFRDSTGTVRGATSVAVQTQ
jgi:subtilase family serine protease